MKTLCQVKEPDIRENSCVIPLVWVILNRQISMPREWITEVTMGWEEEGMGGYCVIGTEFLFGMLESF